MAYLGLFFVGAVLFVNSLSLLGKVDARSAAPINVFVGLLLVVVTFYAVFPARDLTLAENLTTIISTMGFMLFGFTYLYVGILNYAGHPGNGLVLRLGGDDRRARRDGGRSLLLVELPSEPRDRQEHPARGRWPGGGRGEGIGPLPLCSGTQDHLPLACGGEHVE